MSYLHIPLITSIQSVPRSTINLSVPCHGQCQDHTMSADHNRKAAVTAKAKMAQINRRDGVHPFEGRLLKQDSVFQQSFSVMSYEVGRDQTITVEALMNYMMETSVSHPKSLGLDVGGFARTPEMDRRNLMWATRATQISFCRYPSWGDIIEANTWFNASKRDVRRDWLLRDAKTGETVLKAVSLFIMMNTSTRKLSKLSYEILTEAEPHMRKCDPIIHFDDKKVRRMEVEKADHVRRNLTPIWNDIDSNSHVNNVKYINWIIEGVPRSILEKYVLDDVRLEYRRECGRDSELQSLSARVKGDIDRGATNEVTMEFDHLLIQNDGNEIARARTKWKPGRVE